MKKSVLLVCILAAAGVLVMSSCQQGQQGHVSVTGVTVSPATATVVVGNTVQLTATLTPANATDKSVSWVALQQGGTFISVSSSGLVTGLAAGTAQVIVTPRDSGHTAICNITVTASNP